MASQLGARKNSRFKAVSTAPSFNKTPVGSALPPLPYPTVADLSNSVAVVPSVRFNGNPAYVLDQSTQPMCKGDDLGKAGGIRSGTVNGQVKPTKGSSTVRVGGKPIIREGDPCTMNGGNNPGIYVTTPAMSSMPTHLAGHTAADTAAQTQAEQGFFEKATQALTGAAQSYKDKVSESLHDFAAKAMDVGGTVAMAGGATAAVGGGMVATGIGAAPGAVVATAGGATAAVGGGVSAVGGMTESVATGLDAAAEFATSGRLPNLVALGTAYAERMVMSKIEKITQFIPGRKRKAGGNSKPGENKPRREGGGGDGFKVQGGGSDGPCIVGTYGQIKKRCSEGQEAHHIIPDTLNRTSNRAQGAKGIGRIKGMPSLKDGPAICLTGQAKIEGTEHHEAHKGDTEIRAVAQNIDNGPIGTLPVSQAVPIAMASAIRARPECKEQIEAEVRKAYPNHENDQRSMNGAGKPATDKAKAHLENGGTAESGDMNKHGRGRKKQ